MLKVPEMYNIHLTRLQVLNGTFTKMVTFRNYHEPLRTRKQMLQLEMVYLAIMLTWSRLLMCVLAWVCFYCSYKTLTQRNLRSRFIHFTNLRSQSFIVGSQRKNSRQELKQVYLLLCFSRPAQNFSYNTQAHHPRCGKSQLAGRYISIIN